MFLKSSLKALNFLSFLTKFLNHFKLFIQKAFTKVWFVWSGFFLDHLPFELFFSQPHHLCLRIFMDESITTHNTYSSSILYSSSSLQLDTFLCTFPQMNIHITFGFILKWFLSVLNCKKNFFLPLHLRSFYHNISSFFFFSSFFIFMNLFVCIMDTL